jgi:hypothetical protein
MTLQIEEEAMTTSENELSQGVVEVLPATAWVMRTLAEVKRPATEKQDYLATEAANEE